MAAVCFCIPIVYMIVETCRMKKEKLLKIEQF